MSVQKTVTSVTLNDCVTIQAGYPFRGAIRAIPSGSVKAVQAKDISPLGELITDDLITTDLTGKRGADWLKQGDVLFSAKGSKHLASYVSKQLESTTCAPSLFLLRVKPQWQEKVNPQFLTWQLNQAPVQTYFKRSAEGSFQISIRKPVLAATPIALPDIETQNTIAKLYEASIKENALLHKLINNRQQQLNAIASDLIQNSNELKQTN
ncbi:restriction endonuclease subunit S [Vibrio sp. ZSDZ34]|uniref:Restriction endonuclease subunit S n=1 Tax=Vibrio gelatinilyticus TaxID=2893468 RepID=A0A9X2AXH6_9VIBR|nr:restriction endonuclease subunit S [Vibrio gelatinilyticus]MCJ2375552.1 restriction endonuclease subunit S [Vibrio gelatinilyticus]